MISENLQFFSNILFIKSASSKNRSKEWVITTYDI